eukprot:CAMPEP_0179035710 /NCGR_PEP_ID=MMETSP0796-20121207/13248_1 /TAXON_ID=73915 /ORGANISM="Pyrodinium bahamense, Strain pbaha01" /LENGTH=384 /DNA_ID=CAMNT_0020731985 /DNA_START=76 /DNA_END=1230 /DNA_ORIENTATION=+
MSSATLLMSEIGHAPCSEPRWATDGSSVCLLKGGSSDAALPGKSVGECGREAQCPAGGTAGPAASTTGSAALVSERESPGAEEADECAENQLLAALTETDVPDELLTRWTSVEADALAPQQQPPPHAPEPAGAEAEAPPAIPARARQVCLRCLRALVEQYGLSQEEWFDSAALFDGYVRKVGAGVTVADLPALCAVILRMQWKEDAMVREERRTTDEDWADMSSWVAGTLAGAGHPEALEQAVPAGEQTFAHIEVALLNALEWQVHGPHLAKWTTAYFERFAACARAADRSRVLDARQRALDEAVKLTLLQAPSMDCPPQRLARGLLLVVAEAARVAPPGPASASGPLQGFEVVTGSPVGTLQGDYDLAQRLLQRADLLGTEHG